MKIILTAVAASLIAMTANAADRPEWVGYWTENASWCADAGKVGENTPTAYTETGLFGLEWSCEIDSIAPLGIGQSWTVRTTCLDAGYETKDNSIWAITNLDRLLIINQDGYTTELLRCAKAPG